MGRTYLSRNGTNGHGPNKIKPIVDINKPTTIIDQGLFILSANKPHNGLDIPYKAENNRNINPIVSADKLNCVVVQYNREKNINCTINAD